MVMRSEGFFDKKIKDIKEAAVAAEFLQKKDLSFSDQNTLVNIIINDTTADNNEKCRLAANVIQHSYCETPVDSRLLESLAKFVSVTQNCDESHYAANVLASGKIKTVDTLEELANKVTNPFDVVRSIYYGKIPQGELQAKLLDNILTMKADHAITFIEGFPSADALMLWRSDDVAGNVKAAAFEVINGSDCAKVLETDNDLSYFQRLQLQQKVGEGFCIVM